MGMVVSDISTNATATEEVANEADEVNKIGSMIQVLPLCTLSLVELPFSP